MRNPWALIRTNHPERTRHGSAPSRITHKLWQPSKASNYHLNCARFLGSTAADIQMQPYSLRRNPARKRERQEKGKERERGRTDHEVRARNAKVVKLAATPTQPLESDKRCRAQASPTKTDDWRSELTYNRFVGPKAPGQSPVLQIGTADYSCRLHLPIAAAVPDCRKRCDLYTLTPLPERHLSTSS